MRTISIFTVFFFVSFGISGQVNFKKLKEEANKTKEEITKPKVETTSPKEETNSGKPTSGEQKTLVNIKSDPSGLFENISDDPSARSHRAEAVKNLELLEAEYAKEIVNYSSVEEYIAQIDKRLGMVVKLEPAVVKDKFEERYNQIKTPVLNDLEVIQPMKEMSKTLRNKFNASGEYREIEVLAYRKISGYQDAPACYCREHDQTGTYTEFQQLKEDYRAAGAKVPKYKDEATEKSIDKMEKCLENSIKYVDFVTSTDYQKVIVAFSKQEKPSNPTAVITKCEEYLKGLDRIQTDPSINLPEASTNALQTTKVEVEKIKTEAEVYISSGEFEKHKAAVRAERAKLVEMPKAVAKSTSLESQAVNFILKGESFRNYLASTHGDNKKGKPVSSIKTALLHSQCVVKKNALDIPLYQYKEIVVAYKDEDGLCQIVSVYAEYTYKGGGVYASEPTFSSDAPIQIACENINK